MPLRRLKTVGMDDCHHLAHHFAILLHQPRRDALASGASLSRIIMHTSRQQKKGVGLGVERPGHQAAVDVTLIAPLEGRLLCWGATSPRPSAGLERDSH